MTCEVEGCEREAIAEARFRAEPHEHWSESALDRLEDAVIRVCSVHGGDMGHLSFMAPDPLAAADDRPR